MRSSVTAVILLVALTACAGCGKSRSDKALADVCSSRADLKKQVDQLQALTPSTATTATVKDGLTAIRNNLSSIRSAQGKLSDQRRSEVKNATQEFTSQLKTIAGTIGRTLSVQDAKAQLEQALHQLGSSYRSSFARVTCP